MQCYKDTDPSSRIRGKHARSRSNYISILTQLHYATQKCDNLLKGVRSVIDN